MMSIPPGMKTVEYTACQHCGRIYSIGDHSSCPDCHGHGRSKIKAAFPGYWSEEENSIRVPGR